MEKVRSNRDLDIFRADLTSTDNSESYITHSKSKASSVMHKTEENNVPPLQNISSEDNEKTLAVAAAILILLSPPTDNTTS